MTNGTNGADGTNGTDMTDAHPSSMAAMSILAYVLLICATAPKLATCQGTWAVLPVWLVLAGYVASICKSVTSEKEKADRYAQAAWFAYMSYFLLKLVWPFPMHWFDAVATMALLLERGTPESYALLAMYYTAGAAVYAGDGDPLQVTGRGILALVSSIAAVG